MDSYLNRLNQLACTLLTVLAVVSLGNYLTSFNYPQSGTSAVSLNEVYEMSVNKYLEADQAKLSLSANADLSSAWNWNTNQLFVYVSASYMTQKNRRNEVAVWDDIHRQPRSSLIKKLTMVGEYPLRDIHRLLRDRNVTLKLKYRYMPIVGLMKEYEPEEVGGSPTFQTPSDYFRYGGKTRTE